MNGALAALVKRIGMVMVVLGGLAMTALAPEPDPVPKRWEFDLKVGPLRVGTFDAAGAGRRAYFFLTYQVTNTSGQDLLLAPAFDLTTDEGDALRAGRDVPSEVTRQVLDLLDNPLIQDQIGILGMVSQGEENAREGVVIWPVPRPEMDEVAIYAGGFSGEVKSIEIPDASTGAFRKITLRKTMMLRYDTPGILTARGSQPFQPSESRWIMR